MSINKKRKNNHQQSKYLTIMIVPDSTAVKMRSLKVPYWFLHLTGISILCAALVIGVLSGINTYSQRKLEEASKMVEETLVETAKIVEETNNERKELLDQKARVEEQKQNIENVLSSQQGDFEQQLQFYAGQLEEIERKLEEIEKQAVENYEKMDIAGSPVSKSTIETHMGGTYKPILEESLSTADRLNMLLASVSVKCDSTAEFFETYSQDIESFADFSACFPNEWPVWGRVTSEFGGRADPFTGGAASHTGTDIKAGIGTPVKASGDGTVVKAEYVSGYGNLVILSHGYGYETYYAHNSELLVEAGQKVKRGDAVALSGNTGRSTGPHVHFEVRYWGTPKNPRNYVGTISG